MPNTPVLMSPENPDGWKLEELAAQLRSEIEAKCRKIAAETEVDETAYRVHGNNLQIIADLAHIEQLQRYSYHILHVKKGANQGPLGKPRIGVGS